MNYDLFKHLNIIEHKPASKERLTQYHSEDYINFLEKINPKNAPILRKELSNCNLIFLFFDLLLTSIYS
jgi:histone deacetylase 1/2